MTRIDEWAAIVDRLSSLVAARGGQIFADDGHIQLSPKTTGEGIEVTDCGEVALIKVGFAFVVGVSLGCYPPVETTTKVGDIVAAIMEGYAKEIAEVGANGDWLNVRSVVDLPSGLMENTQAATAHGLEVDHSHERRIEPW